MSETTEQIDATPELTEMVAGLPDSLVKKWAEVQEARSAWGNAKATARTRKQEYEAKREEFEKSFQAATESCPLFDDARPEEGVLVGPDGEDESWKGELLSTLFANAGLPHSVIEKFHENEMQTLGQVSDWLNSGKRLTDIPGIGSVKAEMVEQAMQGFWADRKRKMEEVAADGE